jgi:hypothetical protein
MSNGEAVTLVLLLMALAYAYRLDQALAGLAPANRYPRQAALAS